MEELQYADIKEMVDSGYIQEVNRRFFHLLGLNLEVQQHEDGTWELVGIVDFRDDKEGLVYHQVEAEKVKAIQHELDRRIEARQKHFGWFIQPYEIKDSNEEADSTVSE